MPNQARAADVPAAGKQKILLAALEMFAEQGFSGTSVRDIADKSGQAFSLVRFHFGSKKGLRKAVDDHVIDTLHAWFEDNRTDLGSDSNDEFWMNAAKAISGNRPIYRYLRRAVLDNEPSAVELIRRYYEFHKEELKRFAEVGLVRVDYDEKFTPLMTVFLTLGPLVMHPLIESELGVSAYDEKFESEYKVAQREFMFQGIGAKGRK